MPSPPDSPAQPRRTVILISRSTAKTARRSLSRSLAALPHQSTRKPSSTNRSHPPTTPIDFLNSINNPQHTLPWTTPLNSNPLRHAHLPSRTYPPRRSRHRYNNKTRSSGRPRRSNTDPPLKPTSRAFHHPRQRPGFHRFSRNSRHTPRPRRHNTSLTLRRPRPPAPTNHLAPRPSSKRFNKTRA